MASASSIYSDVIEVLEQLIDLADQKKTALLKDDVVALQEVSRAEEAGVKRLTQLEKTRLTQAGLLTEDNEAIQAGRERIRVLLGLLKTKNEFNQTILSDALAYTRFNIQLLQGTQQHSTVYGAEGKIQDFTARQIIDRKG